MGIEDQFKVTEPKPRGTEWPVLKSTQDVSHAYEASDNPPGRMHSDPPCTCGEAKTSPVHFR